MEAYNQSVCHNCLTHGCRGHNCDADDREIHEAIPNVMAVHHENPELQQGLLDAAADTTSAAVVAPLTFGTYFSLAGDADIDSDADDSHPAEQRHRNLNSYFSDEEDNACVFSIRGRGSGTGNARQRRIQSRGRTPFGYILSASSL
jgi:hypothetical protein